MNLQKKGICFAQPTNNLQSIKTLVYQEQSDLNSKATTSKSNINLNSVNGSVNINLSTLNGPITPNSIIFKNQQKKTSNEIPKTIQYNNMNKNYITPYSKMNPATANRQNFKFDLEQENQIKQMQFLQQLQLTKRKSKQFGTKTNIAQQNSNQNITMIKQTIR